MIKTVPNVGQYGINKDSQPQELPENAWSDGANVRFRSGALERMRGAQKVFETPIATPYWIQPYYTATERYWVHAALAGVYADDGSGARLNITPSGAPTGGIDDRWTGGVLNGVLIMNNGKDAPWYWTGTGTLVGLTGWNAAWRASSIRPFKNTLVALGVTKSGTPYPHMVKWSDAAVPGAVPGSWDETDLKKLAGEVDLAEEPSRMVDQLVLGDVNIIYKENSMYAMRATGGTEVFSFQRLPGAVGALARGCMAQTPNGHVVLTHGDVIIHSGQGPQSIITPKLRDWLFRNIDTQYRSRCFVVTNPTSKEVWVCFPELGSDVCTKAAVWNWEDNTWSIRTLDSVTYGAVGQLDAEATSTWDDQNIAWDDITTRWSEDPLSPAQERLLICSTKPLIAAADVTGTIDGAAYTSYARRLGLAFGDPARVKLLKKLTVRFEASKGTRIQFTVGGANSPETEDVNWASPVVHLVGETGYCEVDTFASGRFLAYDIMSLDNQPWRITSIDFDFEMLGRY